MTDVRTNEHTAKVATVATWNELTKFVDSHDGVACVTMHTLRKVAGAGRLGTTVRAMMREKLNSLGLEVIRDELPNTQDATVLLYKSETRVDTLVRAVLDARQGVALTDAAETLRSMNQGLDASTLRVEVLDGLQSLEATIQKAEEMLASN